MCLKTNVLVKITWQTLLCCLLDINWGIVSGWSSSPINTYCNRESIMLFLFFLIGSTTHKTIYYWYLYYDYLGSSYLLFFLLWHLLPMLPSLIIVYVVDKWETCCCCRCRFFDASHIIVDSIHCHYVVINGRLNKIVDVEEVKIGEDEEKKRKKRKRIFCLNDFLMSIIWLSMKCHN